MHHCIRVVTDSEGVKFEKLADEPAPEVTQGSGLSAVESDPTLFALQGKPRFH